MKHKPKHPCAFLEHICASSTPSDSYWAGFRDGWHGHPASRLLEFPESYERGYVLGAFERRAVSREATAEPKP